MTDPEAHSNPAPTFPPATTKAVSSTLPGLALGAGVLTVAGRIVLNAPPLLVLLGVAAVALGILALVRTPAKKTAVAAIVLGSLGVALAISANTAAAQIVRYDRSTLEESIETGADKQGVELDAECPESISADPGESFQCAATLEDGSTLVIDVQLQNRDGEVVWSLR